MKTTVSMTPEDMASYPALAQSWIEWITGNQFARRQISEREIFQGIAADCRSATSMWRSPHWPCGEALALACEAEAMAAERYAAIAPARSRT